MVPHDFLKRVRLRQVRFATLALAVPILLTLAVFVAAPSLTSTSDGGSDPEDRESVAAVGTRSLATRVYVMNPWGSEGNAVINQYALDRGEGTETLEVKVRAGNALLPSPAGGRLYVTSAADPGLSVFDATDGSLVSTSDLTDAYSSNLHLPPSFPPLAVSSDGNWLYLLRWEGDSDVQSVATYDTRREGLLEEVVELGDCEATGLFAQGPEGRVHVLCKGDERGKGDTGLRIWFGRLNQTRGSPRGIG